MTTDRYIEIPNWDGFQHYKDRTPKWIKNYTELLADDAYLGLTGHERGVLHGLWLEYASARCRLAVDTASISRRLGLRVTTATLEALNHAGFIEYSLAPGYHNASPDLEVDKEKKVVQNPRSNGKGAEIAIRTMIANGAIPDLITLNAELTAHALNGTLADELRKLVPPAPVGPDADLPL